MSIKEPTSKDFKKAIKALERCMWMCWTCSRYFKSTKHPNVVVYGGSFLVPVCDRCFKKA